MTNFTYSARDARSITFEDALNPNSTIRFTRTVAPKTVDGYKLTNVRSDTVVLRQVDPRPAAGAPYETNVQEPLSARLILSGSVAATVEMEKELATLLHAVWFNRAALLRGSLPSSTAVVTLDPAVVVTPTP